MKEKAPVRRSAVLVALDGSPNIALDKPVLLIGRHPECDVQLHSRKVSRRHCCVAVLKDCLAVRDLGSTNGIRINGTHVTEGRLKPGDELMIGNLRYRLSLVEPARQAPPKAAAAVAPVAPEDLVSCDFPIPLKEPADLAVGLTGDAPAGYSDPDAEVPMADPVIDPDDPLIQSNGSNH
jgi:predicted component of type VI protein secretion system